jgi:hypothetical protein
MLKAKKVVVIIGWCYRNSWKNSRCYYSTGQEEILFVLEKEVAFRRQ